MSDNPNSRLEAFCDGVFAIALTLLIIDIRIPSTAAISNTHEFWLALKHITPSIFSFLLSFVIILITWVNHHNGLKLAKKSSGLFIYANGVLLLSVVFVPFPTSLMGEYLFTDHASPAVVLYNATLAFQAVGWILLGKAALKSGMPKNETAANMTRTNVSYGFFALILYSICAVLALWIPLTIAIVTTVSWIFWLVWGVRVELQEE